MKNHFGCPVQATANVVVGKWKASEKVLTAQLRELQHDVLRPS